MRQHKLFWGSSYDRGLNHLLRMWPKILEKFPDATLDICYGWGLFDQRYANNPERMAWKKKVEEMMTQKGITHHGKVGKEELNKITKECGIWAYPTDFDEINCITALNCQALGCVPCVINKAALAETVGSGVKVEGEIWDSEVRDEYLSQLIFLMGDEKRWEEEQKKGIEFSKGYLWEKMAEKWIEQFKQTPEEKVMSLIYRDEPLIALKIARKYKLDIVPKIEDKLSHILNWNEYLKKYQDESIQGFRLDDDFMTTADQAYPRFKWVVEEVLKNKYKSIIDCGCYDGALVMTCANLGLEAIGVEMGKDNVKKNIEVANRLKISAKFVQSDILDFKGKADIVTCLEVIEHVPNPKKLVSHLASLGGWVYMSTPLGCYDPKDTKREWNEDGAKFEHVRTYSVKKVDKLLKDYEHYIFSDRQYLYFKFRK
jgi:2-polyprenyl-3-methyl-5-hydroxy-6-metoxy-1,4-benzoquinol methylase